LRIALAQIGARRHYAIPAILESAGLLERFYTDLCANVGPLAVVGRAIPARLQPRGLRRLLARRVGGVPDEKIVCFPTFALRRVVGRAKAGSPGARLRFWARANARFGRLVLRRGLGEADTLYAFNGAAVELFQYAKSRAMRTILEQTDAPVAVEETLLAEERERWPGWESGGASPQDWKPMADRETAEWDLADTIICGSEYVQDGVEAESGPVERCRVVHYGAPGEFYRETPKIRSRGQLRVLFVGNVCLRKGVPYLLEAARLLNPENVQFRVVGPVNVAGAAVGQLREHVELLGPVPRSEVARQYECADVLVLPSISEGSANVCYEALAAGLPVITTPHAGSVVRDGQEGYVVPIRSAEDIADRILRLIDDDALYEQFSHNALARAEEFTWDRYANRLLSALCAEHDPTPQPATGAFQWSSN